MERDRDDEAEDLKCTSCREPIYHGHLLRRLQDCVNNDGRVVVTDEHDPKVFCSMECIRDFMDTEECVTFPRFAGQLPRGENASGVHHVSTQETEVHGRAEG